jgi:RNA polymerase sigma-70 factor (ECF subfamily)
LKSEQKKVGKNSNIGLKLRQEELNFFTNSEKSILEFDIKDRIRKTIDRLPERCSEVFKDSRYGCLSNKEIAEKYDISVKAVEKHISKALSIFREEFKDFLVLLLLFLLQRLF